MPYLIGTDEAGYGPNLGPLLIAATVWHVPDDCAATDLYKRLKKSVCQTPRNERDRRVWWADSKAVYRAGAGLDMLERGLLVALCNLGIDSLPLPESCAAVWRVLDPHAELHQQTVPWPVHASGRFPVANEPTRLKKPAAALAADLTAQRVRLVSIRATTVFPERFNALTEQLGTKGEVLSRLTLTLAAEAARDLTDEPVLFLCDKHGGRNRYGGLLQDIFYEHFVEVLAEGQTESRYGWGPPANRREIRFRVQSERFLPAALASMTAKYLRELAMRAFNEFWCGRLPDLRPTAGYPGDARRYKDEIAALQRDLGIADQRLWRNR
ncbi:MAG TPA: hypothetical protein VFE24_14215 [Pirellulales bacterium]|jgi:hypothetical protein|nr:hypothetical protein [Pirellulales bacterium]